MTIKNHIINYLKYLEQSDIFVFYTSDIQNLSERSKKVFGRRLGSPSTYERVFRQLRQDGKVKVSKGRNKNKRESGWFLRKVIND
tara:strand:- start:141 stop:395 length:255 start_codon:yes stop_codon:yes gene_type:complete